MKWIEIIETDRSKDNAYVAWCQDEPYWATNIEVSLEWVESLLGYFLEDGFHNFIKIKINDIIIRKGYFDG